MIRCRFSLSSRQHSRFAAAGPTLAMLAALIAWDLTAAQPVSAQLLARSMVLQGARVFTMDGAIVEGGTVVITGTKIGAVGRDVGVPLLAQTIDAQGTTVTPGLIDVDSLLARGESSGTGGASPTRRAEDAFDRYDTATIEEALQQGITAIFVSPRGPAGMCGTGAVIRLVRDTSGSGSYGKVLKSEAALCVDLASHATAVTRLKTLESVRKAFRDALEYRRSLEGYEEDLAEYTRKLEEQAAQKATPQETPAEKPKAPSPPPGAPAAEEGASETKVAGQAGAGEKSQKPRRPRRDPKLELILQALDGEMPVRVAAHHSSDILNALELAEEFSLRLILEGATEAHLVTREIADAGAAVILGQMDLPGMARNDVHRRAANRPGQLLDAARVPWVVGSGASASQRARFTAFNAQLATAYAAGRDPLRVITADAASVLRVDEQIGRLRPGMLADLVVWSGDPLDPATQVLRVFINGQQVYSSVD